MPVEQLNHAIALIKSGQKDSARDMLTQLVRAEPTNETAWLWLAESMPDDTARVQVLEASFRANPQSQKLQLGLERLRERHEAGVKPSSPPTSPEVEDPVLLRQALIGKSQTPQSETLPEPADQAGVYYPYGPVSQTGEQAQKIPSGSKQSQKKATREQKLTAGQHSRTLVRGFFLILLGLLTVTVVGFSAYFMRGQLRAWLGFSGKGVTPTLDLRVLTPSVNIYTTPTPLVPTPTVTSTPTITPVPTPTATVAFSFSYSGISPENGAQVVQVGEFASVPARSVAISYDNRYLAAGMNDATVFVWEIAGGAILHIFKGHTQPVNSVAFSVDGRFLISGSEDGTVRIWDLNADQELSTLRGHNGAVKSVAVSPDGRTFASGASDGSLFLWQIGSDTALSTLPADGPVTSLDFSKDGRLLAVGLETGAVKVWDVASSSLLKTMLGHSASVNSVRFAPSGHRLVTGSSDTSVKLWDVDSGKVLFTIGSHTEAVLSVAFSPDGRVVASASAGQTIKLWDVAAHREIATLRHTRNMPEITFSQDGRVLAAALTPTNPLSDEGGVAIWGIFGSETQATLEPLILSALQAETWSPGARMAIPHVSHQSVQISGGRVLIIGGGVGDDSASYPLKVELYNPVSGASLLTGGLNTGRASFSSTMLMDGRILVVGGYNPDQKWLASAEIYDPVSGTWSLSQPLYNHGVGHTATLLNDRRVLITGGRMGDGISGCTNQTELFDPASNTWMDAGVLSQSRCGHSAVLLTDGRVLIAGGENGEIDLSSAEVFNPITAIWSPTGDLNVARHNAAAMQLADGKVMITGGLKNVSGGLETLNTVEVYNPQDGKWEQAAPMSKSRYGHTMDLLPGGLVLVTGGLDVSGLSSKQYLDNVEVYDPQANTWTSIASLSESRAFHTATLLTDGRIFVAGGMNAEGESLASTELLVVSRSPIQPILTPYIWDTNTPTITPEISITTTLTSTLTSTLSIESTLTPTPSPSPLPILISTPTPTSTPEGGTSLISPATVVRLDFHTLEGLIYFKSALYL